MDLTFGGTVRTVSIDRGDGRNAIDDGLVASLAAELDAAEADPACRVVVLTSAPEVFCTGMDLVAAGSATGRSSDSTAGASGGGPFFDLLRRFTTVPRIVACAVDGTVAGGGVGLAAASDLVYATPRSTFALPEALWGLLPCCVLPFLARRVGWQPAYAMALTTQPVPAAAAAAGNLVDEVAEDPSVPVRRLAFRAGKLDPDTVGDLKRYGQRLFPVTDDTRRLAVDELDRLMTRPAVRRRLDGFARDGRFPWQG